MARPSKTDQERGYLDMFWREIRVMEADYAGGFTVFTYPTIRPGVFNFRFVFTPHEGEGPGYMGQQAVNFDYPTAATQTMAASLWTHAMKLHSLVAEVHRMTKARRNGTA